MACFCQEKAGTENEYITSLPRIYIHYTDSFSFGNHPDCTPESFLTAASNFSTPAPPPVPIHFKMITGHKNKTNKLIETRKADQRDLTRRSCIMITPTFSLSRKASDQQL